MSKKAVKILPTGRHAFYALDPGQTSGAAWGVVDLTDSRAPTKDVLQAMAWDAHEFGGAGSDYFDQACEIFDHIEVCVASWQIDNIGWSAIHFVAEDFVLRMPARTAKREMLSPVRVLHTLEGLLGWTFVARQASQAKTYATDDRLRLWQMWAKGSPHKRDALRHLALGVMKVRDGGAT